jgi:hypothetical protein
MYDLAKSLKTLSTILTVINLHALRTCRAKTFNSMTTKVALAYHMKQRVTNWFQSEYW